VAVFSFKLTPSSFTFVVADSYAQKSSYTATVDKDGVQRVEVVGGSYFFKPDCIIVKVHMPVELSIRKEGSLFVPHDMVVPAPEAGIDFSETLEKEPKGIKFAPTKVGTYPFYCGKRFFCSLKAIGKKESH
jgi:plastocyanin domain-containing protein